jgi:hypothetical protein
MSSAYKIALSTTKKAQEHQKDGYDLKTRGGIVEVGDTVLVKLEVMVLVQIVESTVSFQ